MGGNGVISDAWKSRKPFNFSRLRHVIIFWHSGCVQSVRFILASNDNDHQVPAKFGKMHPNIRLARGAGDYMQSIHMK